MCALKHILAYKFTYSRYDMHMIIILIYDCCIINLFAATRRAGTIASNTLKLIIIRIHTLAHTH